MLERCPTVGQARGVLNSAVASLKMAPILESRGGFWRDLRFLDLQMLFFG